MHGRLTKIVLTVYAVHIAASPVDIQVTKSATSLLHSAQEEETGASALLSKVERACHDQRLGKLATSQRFMHSMLTNDLEEQQAVTREILGSISHIRARKELLKLDLEALNRELKQLGNATIVTKMRKNRLKAAASLEFQINTWLPMLSEGQQRVAMTKRHRNARDTVAHNLFAVSIRHQKVCFAWHAALTEQSRDRMAAVRALMRSLDELRTPPSFLQLREPSKVDALVSRFKDEVASTHSKQWCAEEIARTGVQRQEAVDTLRRVTALHEMDEHSSRESAGQMEDAASMKKIFQQNLAQFAALEKDVGSFLQQVAQRAPLAVKIVSRTISLLDARHSSIPPLRQALAAFRSLASDSGNLTMTRADNPEVFHPLESYFTISRDELEDETSLKMDAVRRAQASVAAAEHFVAKLHEECDMADEIRQTLSADVQTLEGVKDRGVKKKRMEKRATSPLEQAALEIGVPL